MCRANIIAAFAGCGKSTFTKEATLHGKKVLDLDTSLYSHFIDTSGQKIPNPFFIENYENAIKRNLENYDYILIGTHKEVRDMLRKNNIKYTLVYPNIHLKSEYLVRYLYRGDNNSFILGIVDNWDKFIVQMMSEEYPSKIELKSNEYLYDVIKF